MVSAPFTFHTKNNYNIEEICQKFNERLDLRRAKEGEKKVLAARQRLSQAACEPINDLACILGAY